MDLFKITKDYEKVNWDKLIKVLMAYAYVLIGDENKKMNKSKADLAYDFAMDTITQYLHNKSKFDPTRNPDLVKYLKYNILRQLISNSKVTGNIKYEKTSESIKIDSYSITEKLITDIKIDEKIDTDRIINIVEEKIANDDDLTIIFNCRYYSNSKRSEICKDLNISEKEYDNRIKRLRRIVAKTIKALTDHE